MLMNYESVNVGVRVVEMKIFKDLRLEISLKI